MSLSYLLVWTGVYILKYIAYILVAIGSILIGKKWGEHSRKKKALKAEINDR